MELRERYDELCRLCASYDAVKMDIFGQEGKNRQLVDKIQTCLPFKIAEDDRLPKCLCYRCMYNLENFFDFRTACVNAVAMLERSLPTNTLGEITTKLEKHSELRSELLKEKEKMPILIPEAPIVNPNAALGTPPRLNSDGEADQEIEEILEHSGTEEGIEDLDDRKSDVFEIDMDPSDFLEMPPMVTEEESDIRSQQIKPQAPAVFQHTSEQHEVYVCSLCNKAFSSKGHLSLHARIHVGAGDVIGEKVITDDHTSYKRPYQCDLCNKSYSTAKHRWGHVSTSHRGHPAVTCRYCSRIYSTRINLEEHIKSRHTGLPPPAEQQLTMPYVQPENRYQCKTCPKMYTNVTDLNKHSRICAGERTKKSASHSKVHHPTRSKGKSLMDTSEASSAESDDDTNKDYKNAEAKLSKNPQLTILKQALTRNDGLKRGGGDSESKNSLLKSTKAHHDTSNHHHHAGGDNSELEKRWFCETCPKSFTSVDTLKEHEISHEADKPYICILCEKDFVLKSSLSRHIVASHGVDPIPIIDSDKCLKKTVMAQMNAKHALRVEELRSSNRESSESSFSPVPQIDQEEDDGGSASGSGGGGRGGNGQDNLIEIETVFVCEICTRDFNDRASLWLHIRATHKEYAAFACGVCLKICSDNEQLLNHVNMYHGGSKLLVSEQRRYSCTICGRQHDSKKKLMTHVSIHNVDPSYDPASFVQLNTNYYNENINSNEAQEQPVDFDNDDGEKVDCFICYKSFPNEDHLIRHQRNAHKSESVVFSGESGNMNSSGINPNGNKAQYHLFFVCELCGMSHPSKWERWLHVSSVHGDEPLIRCDKEDCAKIFATKALKNEHHQHHVIQGASPNTCEICGKLWGSRVDYWKHVMGVHSDTVPLICGVCLKVFPDVVQLARHVRTKHWPLTNGDFSCDICGRPYSNKSKMLRHRKIHGLDVEGYNNGLNDSVNDFINPELNAPELDMSCDICVDIPFSTWDELCQHRRTVHGLFPCDLCNKCYGRTSHLWKHVNRVHKGHKDVTCRYCLKTSASKDHLAAHIAKIHRYEPEKESIRDSTSQKIQNVEEDIVHYCQKCKKGFHKRYLLRRHMKGCQNYRKDPGALLTRCRACERIFKDRASLQKHIENHHSTYTCHLCNETITSKLGIMTHNRVNHMDHPDLTCSHSSCKKLFRTKEDLESHRKDHKYHNSPNVCDFCGDTVDNKLKLKMHILSLHRNEIGVSCGVCLIPMKDPQELKNHVEDVHPGVLLKPNTCQVCGKQYASKWKAFDHTKKCHGKVFRTCKQCLSVFTTDSDIRYHYEHIHNVPKDQISGVENHLDLSAKGDDADTSGVAIKEEPDDMEYDDGLYDDIPHVRESKRKRAHDTYDCEMCPEIFLNKDTLSQHYRTIHNIDPDRMFKKAKTTSSKKKIKNRENFECQNCNKQFCTKSLFWNHINTCTDKTKDSTSTPSKFTGSILESHLKNNNQITKEAVEPMLNESNLNIPDFNLFEDINMQLSGQKPVPNLMPLSQVKPSQGSIKCYRKDSRKVYDESTNTVCACEVCGKQWPAKKHLWQHLIRFHRAEAAVTCGVCLKLCTNYKDLSQHLKDAHEAILSGEGNNFTCKTCGRYHNARSKLLLHMSIHINNNEQIWCQKCAANFDSAEKLEQHTAKCMAKRKIEGNEFEDQSNDVEESKADGEEDKGSLIGDSASLLGEGDEEEEEEEEEEADFDSEAEEGVSVNAEEENSHSDSSNDSDSDAATSASENEEDNDIESRSNSRITGDVSYHTDTEDRDSEVESEIEDIQEERRRSRRASQSSESKSNHKSSPKNDNKSNPSVNSQVKGKKQVDPAETDRKERLKEEREDSDDDGPPVLSPIRPLSSNNEGEEGEFSPEDDENIKSSPRTQEDQPEEDNASVNDDGDNAEKEADMSAHSNTVDDDEFSAVKSNASAGLSGEDESDGQAEQDENMEDDDSRLHMEHSETEKAAEVEENTGDEENDGGDEEFCEGEESQGMQLDDLDGTVLMVANDAEGNEILIQQNVAEMSNGEEEEEEEEEGSMEEVESFLYQDEEGNYEDEYREQTNEIQNDEDEEMAMVKEEEEEEEEEEAAREASDDLEANSSAKNEVSRT